MDRSAILKSILGAVIAAPFAYLLKKTFEAWGILDPVAATMGGWLKVHVPPATAGWTLAVLISGALYALLLWKVWRPRYIHMALATETNAEPNLVMEVQRAPAASSGRDLSQDQKANLPESVTAQYLIDQCEGKTNIESEGAISRYLGHRIRVSGIIYAASRCGQQTSVSIELERGKLHPTAFLVFDQDQEQVGLMRQGDLLTVIGRLTHVTSTEVRLVDCCLVD